MTSEKKTVGYELAERAEYVDVGCAVRCRAVLLGDVLGAIRHYLEPTRAVLFPGHICQNRSAGPAVAHQSR